MPTPVYFGESYQALVARYDKTERRNLVFQDGTDKTYFPLLVRDLGHGAREAYSAYGYGGALGKATLSPNALDQLKEFLAGEGIVAVFLRNTPYLENHRLFPDAASEFNRRTYVVDLAVSQSYENFVRSLPQKLRWSANKATREGLSVSFYRGSACTNEQTARFYHIYSELMRAKKASGYLRFSLQFFLDHLDVLGDDCELAEILDPVSGELLAAAFFLKDRMGWAHYHLSAGTIRAHKMQALELLMTASIFHYGNLNLQYLHLGGGLKMDESDGLSRFKAKFASRSLDFYCTKLICDNVGYANARARKPLKNENLFLIGDARGN